MCNAEDVNMVNGLHLYSTLQCMPYIHTHIHPFLAEATIQGVNLLIRSN